MATPISALEISSNAVKLVVGYKLNNRPTILYAGTYFVNVDILDNETDDFSEIEKGIKHLIAEAEGTLNIKIDSVILGIPSIDLAVYSDSPVTPIFDEGGKIANRDIKSIFTMIRKNCETNMVNLRDKKVINIVPDSYVLDDGRTFKKSPINEVTTSLKINCVVYLLPLEIYERVTSVVTSSGLNITKSFVSEYSLMSLLQETMSLPSTYFLIDFGAKVTTISFINQDKLYFTSFLGVGSNDLTKLISARLGISFEDAKALKEYYGYDLRKNRFVKPFVLPSGEQKEIYQNDLNEVIKEFFKTYKSSLNEAITAMKVRYNINTTNNTYPRYFIGGGVHLNGFKTLISEGDSLINPEVIKINIMGARHGSYSTCLGLILSYEDYFEQIGNEQSDVGTLSRQ